jgi:hypothetical protein
MQTKRKLGISLLVLFMSSIGIAIGHTQSFTFTTIDVPRAVFTVGRGINTGRDIVGWYEDGNGVAHGYLLSSGGTLYNPIDVPTAFNAIGTTALGINDSGTIVGSYFVQPLGAGTPVHQRGYMLTGFGGTFTSVVFPGAPVTDTVARYIDSSGKIIGFYADAAGTHGFLLSAGTFQSIDFPGAVFTLATGISPSTGEIVGFYGGTGASVHGFTLSGVGGSFTTIPSPAAGANFAWGANDLGQVVGFFGGVSPRDYLLSGGVFSTITLPGATSICNFAINNGGDIVGQYTSSDGKTHGFSAKRAP